MRQSFGLNERRLSTLLRLSNRPSFMGHETWGITTDHSFRRGVSTDPPPPDQSWQQRQAILQGAEAETRAAMARWRQLLLQDPAISPADASLTIPPFMEDPLLRISCGAENAALLLSELHDLSFDGIPQMDSDSMPCEEWSATLKDSGDNPQVASRRILDQMAGQIRAGNPGLFLSPASLHDKASAPVRPVGEGADSNRTSVTRAVYTSLFMDGKRPFRYEPFEWVYDGLAPLLLPDVLRKRRGVPISLAVVLCGVAHRLGLTAVPFCGFPSGGSAVPDNAPPEIIAKKAGRALLAAPLPDYWLVAFPPPHAYLTTEERLLATRGSLHESPEQQHSLAQGTLFVDLGRQQATLLDWSQLKTKLPKAARSYVSSIMSDPHLHPAGFITCRALTL